MCKISQKVVDCQNEVKAVLQVVREIPRSGKCKVRIYVTTCTTRMQMWVLDWIAPNDHNSMQYLYYLSDFRVGPRIQR